MGRLFAVACVALMCLPACGKNKDDESPLKVRGRMIFAGQMLLYAELGDKLVPLPPKLSDREREFLTGQSKRRRRRPRYRPRYRPPYRNTYRPYRSNPYRSKPYRYRRYDRRRP